MKYWIETAEQDVREFEEFEETETLEYLLELLHDEMPFQIGYKYTNEELAQMDAEDEVTEIAYHPNYH